jgi:hypothetical protein
LLFLHSFFLLKEKIEGSFETLFFYLIGDKKYSLSELKVIIENLYSEMNQVFSGKIHFSLLNITKEIPNNKIEIMYSNRVLEDIERNSEEYLLKNIIFKDEHIELPYLVKNIIEKLYMKDENFVQDEIVNKFTNMSHLKRDRLKSTIDISLKRDEIEEVCQLCENNNKKGKLYKLSCGDKFCQICLKEIIKMNNSYCTICNNSIIDDIELLKKEEDLKLLNDKEIKEEIEGLNDENNQSGK